VISSRPDSIEHVPALAIRLPKGALALPEGNVDRRLRVLHLARPALSLALGAWATLGSSEGAALRFGDRSVWLTTGLGVAAWAVGDVTGDGRADLMLQTNSVGSAGATAQTVSVAISAGTRFDTLQIWSTSPCPQTGGCGLYQLADVNGDGKADLVAFAWGAREAPGWANVWVSLSDGSRFGPAQLWHQSFCIREQVCRTADVDGDGRADLVAFTPLTGLVWVSLSQGTGFGPNAIGQGYFCVTGERCLVADANGDGKADLVAFKPGALGVEKGNVLVALSNGKAFGPAQLWHGYFCVGTERCLVGDLNGDAQADVLLLKPWGNALQSLASLSTGKQFVNAVPFSWSDVISGGTADALTGDVTGDKKADLVTYEIGANGARRDFVVYPALAVETPSCPPGQYRDPSSGACRRPPDAHGYSKVDVYNCNVNTDAEGQHRPVTIYSRDLNVAQAVYARAGTLDAQYNAMGQCPFDDNGIPADPLTVDLTPYGYNNGHTIEITVVDRGLLTCEGTDDPSLDNCVRQRTYDLADQDGDTAKYVVN